MTEIDRYLSDIKRLCVLYNVRTLYAFGSVLSDQLTDKSDIDFIVDFDSIELKKYADNYFNLKFSLQDILKRPIDLLEEKAIRNPYFKQSVNNQQKLVYGHWNKTWLYDILNAINEIDSFFADQPKEFDAYKNDIRTRRAVERNIEIIGEAANRILQKDDTIALSNSRKMVDTRNWIIHGYDTVSDEVIWGIVDQYLPILKTEIENLLGE